MPAHNTRQETSVSQNGRRELAQLFYDYFDLIPADNMALQREVYAIRYQVYCEHLQFESVENNPNCLEYDEHDRFSNHCLLQHKATGCYVGCVRVIHKRDTDLLPFETLLGERKSTITGSYSEISRLAILPKYTRTERKKTAAAHDFEERQLLPYISLGLILAGAACVLRSGNQCSFATMEPRLARLLTRLGVHCEPISGLVEHHGHRAVYIIYPVQRHKAPDPMIETMLQHTVKAIQKANFVHPDSTGNTLPTQHKTHPNLSSIR